MDMDDDFIGEIEFDPSAQQQEIIRRAIDLASNSDDEFCRINPLIAVMQWWEANGVGSEEIAATPEARLAEACRQFLLFHEGTASPSAAKHS